MKEKNLSKVKSIITGKESVFTAKSKLEASGLEVFCQTEITDLHKERRMRVIFDDPPAFMGGILYAAGVPHRTVATSVLITSDASGRIISIE